ncbi:hypothetical protein U1Q18_025881 [Sarracenia purpurea var. burkii]
MNPPDSEYGFFPDEVVIQILARLSVKDIIRSKCVCKLWGFRAHRIEIPVTRFYPDGEATLVGLVCDLSMQKFNVVLAGHHRSIGHRPDKTFICLIFDSESSKWRKFVSFQDDCFTHMNRNQAVYLNGSLHWLTGSCSCILVLDLKYDIWGELLLPEEVICGTGIRVHLLELDGNLPIVQISEAGMIIWLLKNYDKEEWEMMDRVSLGCIRGMVPGIFPISQTGRYIVLATHKQVLMYHRDSRVWKDMCSVENSFALPGFLHMPVKAPCSLAAEVARI